MSLFNRKQNTGDNPIPEDLKPYYANNSGVRRWIGPVLRGVLLLALVGLLVWGGIWSVNKIINRDTKGQTATTAQKDAPATTKSPSTATTPSTSPKATPAPAPQTSAPATTPAPAVTPAPQASTPVAVAPSTPTPSPATTVTDPAASSSAPAATPSAPADLANTGPGETIALFVGAMVIGTVAYHIYLIRRHNIAD